MAPSLSTRSGDFLGARASDGALDHALSLLLADEPEAALRWGAAALEHDPWTPGAILVTSRLLSQVGRSRAAVDGLLLAMRRAVDAGDLPLAMVAIDQLRMLGVGVDGLLDEVASAFCEESPRLQPGELPPPRPAIADFQPLSPLLTGSSLASKASQILLAAKHSDDGREEGAEPRSFAPAPLFSALSKGALRDLLEALETTIVPAGHRLIQERKDGGAAYIVANGSLEISRRPAETSGKPRTVLGRVGTGGLVGEISLLARLPSAATVTATCPSILLVAKRHAIEPVAERHPELASQLAAHCRRHAVANLGWASTVISAVPPQECAALVERLRTRTFEKGEKLVAFGEESHGLHLIVAGEVAVVGREGDGRVMLGARLPGETVGEVELILCQRASVDAIAVRDTATLLLSPEEFFGLVRERPAMLHGLYAIAVRRHTETRIALESGSAAGVDEFEEVNDNRLPEGDPPPAARAPAPADVASRRAANSRPPEFPSEAANVVTATPPPVHSVIPSVPVSEVKSSSPPPLRSPAFASVPPAVPVSTSVPLRPPPRTRPWLTMRELALVAAVASVVFVIVSLLGRPADRLGTSTSAARAGSATAERPSTESAKAVPAAVAPPTSTVSATTTAEVLPTPQVLTPIVVAAPKLAKPRARAPVASPPASSIREAIPAETGASAASVGTGTAATKPGPLLSQSKTESGTGSGAADEFGGRQ